MKIKELIEMYVAEIAGMPGKTFGATHLYCLRRLQKDPIAEIEAEKLTPQDLIAFAKRRRQTVSPATVTQDLTYLKSPFDYAALGFNRADITPLAFVQAKPILGKNNLTGKGRPRDRRPTAEEIDRLNAYFDLHDREIPMRVLFEFARVSCRRRSEITRLMWGDVDMENRTCLVRDMKDPKMKKGHNHRFALLGRAWEIVMQQPRRAVNVPTERIFPYNSKSVGAAYTRAKKALGIDNLRFHDNRREGASSLFEQGYGVAEVMVQTGHKTPAMLMRVYQKLNAADLHKGPAGSHR